MNRTNAAVVVPPNLSGKTLKVVTRDYNDEDGRFAPLRGKTYDDNTPILTPMKDIVKALGGKYTELDDMTLGG